MTERATMTDWSERPTKLQGSRISMSMTPDFVSALQAGLEANLLALLRLAQRLADDERADMCRERHVTAAQQQHVLAIRG